MNNKIAFKNIKNNIKKYFSYFSSLSSILTLYMILRIFSNDPIVTNSLSSSETVNSMSTVVSIVFAIFISFYIIYFNIIFIKQRSNELGIYSMLGMNNYNIFGILFSETFINTLMSFIFSSIISPIIYFIIRIIIINYLSLSISNSLIIPKEAFINTGILTIFMIIIIDIVNFFLLIKKTSIELVNYKIKSEKKIKLSKGKSILGIVLLIISYSLTIDLIKRPNSIWDIYGFIPVSIVVIILCTIGSNLFIKYSFTMYVNSKIKNTKKIYKPINNILWPRIINRIQTKSRLLINLSLIISATVGAMCIAFLVNNIEAPQIQRTTPSAIELTNNNKSKQINHVINNLSKKYNGKVNNINLLITKIKPDIQISKNKYTDTFNLMKYDDYISLTKNIGYKNIKYPKINKNNGILIPFYPNENTNINRKKYHIDNSKDSIVLKEFMNENPVSFINSASTVVVSNRYYDNIKRKIRNTKKIYTINGNNLYKSKSLYSNSNTLLKKFDKNIISLYKNLDKSSKYNSPTYLILTFLAILFLISMGSILYFTIIQESLRVKNEYDLMKNLGYNMKQQKSLIRRETLGMFIPPLFIGLLNGIAAFIGARYALLPSGSIVTGNNIIINPIIIMLILFIFIYAIIYIITSTAVIKKIVK